MNTERFVYSVLPFGGKTFGKNQARLKSGDVPCAICGRAVLKPYKFQAAVVGGGDWARNQTESDNTADPGYMGWWPIGPDCHKRYLVSKWEGS